MGKRKGVKANTKMNMNKNGNGNGETSTSSSMQISKGRNNSTDNKIRGRGNSGKKMKRGEASNCCVGIESSAGQRQESKAKKVSMNDFPGNMVKKILECVDTRNLFNCRLVNRNWSEISTGILRNRSNTFTQFQHIYGEILWTHSVYAEGEERSLGDFLTCIKNSKDSPFSQFYFSMEDNEDPLQFFNEQDFKDFTSYFVSSNQRLKCLSLSFDYLNNIQMFTPKLSDLLLNKIPRLEELVLYFPRMLPEAPEVKLFPMQKRIQSETNSNQVPVPVQLPHLKVLRFESPMILPYTEIFKDLLNAAVNLKCLCMRIYKLADFQFLHSLGKLNLLKEAIITINRDFFSATESYETGAPLSLPLPKLEILDVGIDQHEIVGISSLQATNFLVNLFESSKDTLTELTSGPVGFCPGLQPPTFTKLRKLELSHYSTSPHPVFPPGIRARDVFPVVSQLDLNIDLWASAFPQEDSIPLLPHVKVLRMDDTKFKENSFSVLPLMCPNLKKLKIHNDNNYYTPKLNFLNVGRAIWTHMKQLESLEIDVDLDEPENNPFALDSCFTGISVGNCKRLYKLKKAKKLLKKCGSQVRIPESEFAAEREHPSILDMKDLKTLKINPYSEKKLLKKTDFFTENLTWVSKKYAFKFLPHLKPKQKKRKKTKINV